MQPMYPPQQYPAQPAPQYPTAPTAGYPMAPAPGYPTAPQPGYPPMGYPVVGGYPPAPQYPAQAGYGQPPVPPAVPLAPGSLDSFYTAPSASGGPSFKFQGKPVGTSYIGMVERPVTDADVRQQTNNAGTPQIYKDGRPKFVMIVPMLVQQSAEFPEGKAGWWVKGQARDELVRAMAAAGAPAGAPEAGAVIRVTLTGHRNVPGMNPQFLYQIEYQRPHGAGEGGAAVPPAQPAQPAQPVQPNYAGPVPAYAPQVAPTLPPGAYAPPMGYAPQAQAQPAYVPGMEGQQIPALNIGQNVTPPMQGYAPAPAPQYAPQAAPVPAPQAMAAVAAGQPAPAQPAAGIGALNPEQMALMSRLTGQPA